MKIVILDKYSMGNDISVSPLIPLGEIYEYERSTPDEALARSRDADVLIINKIKITKEIMDNAPNLKLVCVFATGYDNIDVEYARKKGIGVCNVPGYSTDSVVLYTFATVLSLSSRLFEYNRYVRSGDYTASGLANLVSPVFHEIRGKTWGIIGYGNIGRAVSEVAKAMGAKVIVYKRNPTDDNVEFVSLDDLCQRSDIITIHCPLNDQSRNMINNHYLSMMRPDVILVNEARGAVLDELAVADYVKTGKLKFFGCDVYSIEPFGKDHPYHEIKDLPGVILTPHSAWAAYEARQRCIDIISNNISSFLNGEKLNRVDI